MRFPDSKRSCDILFCKIKLNQVQVCSMLLIWIFFQIRLQHSIVGRQWPRHFILDAICGAYQCSGPPLQFYRTNRLRQVSVLYLFLLGWWCRTTLQFKFNYRKVIKMLMVPDDVSYYNFSFDMRLPTTQIYEIYVYVHAIQCLTIFYTLPHSMRKEICYS